MRLIDADALKKKIPEVSADIFENCGRCKLLDDVEVRYLIDSMPTIDAEPRWIPVKTRPMTVEERKYFEEYLGWRLSDDDAVMFESKMPYDGQEVWICSKCGYVYTDVCIIDEGIGLEGNGDWMDIAAWMPFDRPKPYREVEE